MTPSGVGHVSSWRWAVPGAVIATVGAVLALAGALDVADVVGAPGPSPEGAGRLLAGLVVGLVGVAMLAGATRSSERFHAVAIARPLHDVAHVSLGDGYHDGLEALGVDPFYVVTGTLPRAVLAVDDTGLELWFGGRRPEVRASVPWAAVDAVVPAASHAGAATAPAAALEVGGERLLLVPRRGTVGHGWATLDEALAFVHHLERLRTGEEPDLPGEPHDEERADPEPVDGSVDDPWAAVDVEPVTEPPYVASDPVPGDRPAISVDDRIRRLAGTDGPDA